MRCPGWSLRRSGRWTLGFLVLAAGVANFAIPRRALAQDSPRERISLDDDWRFSRGDPTQPPVDLSLSPGRGGGGGPNAGGSFGGGRGRGTPSADAAALLQANPLWAYILPTGNDFVTEPEKILKRPDGNPVAGMGVLAGNFDDSSWRQLDLPHDFGIEGPFAVPGQPAAFASSGGTGRLPYSGTAWYRKHLAIPASDAGRQIYLDLDGAMAYAAVFLNGQIVGGWPYGYASWRVDLTPYIKTGGDNLLAIRIDNPPNSSRWYPGGGIYRNVWLVKTDPVHVSHWGTYVTTPEVSAMSAGVKFSVTVENDAGTAADATVFTAIYELARDGTISSSAAATIPAASVHLDAGKNATAQGQATIMEPKLWMPFPGTPNRYLARTTVTVAGKTVDSTDTPFGIRDVKYEPDAGLSINGQHLKMNGVCDHHDLGALGSAINFRALQRQLQILQSMGCNAIRTSHNPPAPELLELADSMGFMVMDETFDTWRGTKSPNDYGRIFNAWHEQDTRALVRRDRNHPSVILWSVGNEVGEQGQGQSGAAVAQELCKIVHEEDPTRPTAAAENSASAGSPFSQAIDTVGLNYQGSRPARNYPNGLYPSFHQAFPDKFIFGSETASTISSRGEYTFPVARGHGAVAGAQDGEDVPDHQMSSYDLYYPSWATSPDTEFAAQDHFPYVGGEFVWTGFDYLGEPTPWGGGNDPSRSSYFGIIDLAGFPKDRFYLYQAHWRPDFPMAHILPHWNWPDRVGQVTPVHVYTSGDEAELFLNGQSLGRKKKGEFEYRIRWDDVVYQPGELRVVAYKDGKEWATDTVKTTGPAAKLLLKPDRTKIADDGHDLSFVTLTVADAEGLMVPRTKNLIHFSVQGPGEIVVTDNGDPTDLSIFSNPDRKAFNGLALAIIKAKRGSPGAITLTAKSEGLADATATITPAP